MTCFDESEEWYYYYNTQLIYIKAGNKFKELDLFAFANVTKLLSYNQCNGFSLDMFLKCFYQSFKHSKIKDIRKDILDSTKHEISNMDKKKRLMFI